MFTRHDLIVVKQAKGPFEGLKASWLVIKQGKLGPKRLGGDDVSRHKRLIQSSVLPATAIHPRINGSAVLHIDEVS
jgi:hypothetical protein